MYKNIFIIAIITVFFISCNGNGQNTISKNDALALMDEFFEKTKENNFDLVEMYYSESIYQQTPKEEWEEMYTKIHNLLGTLVSVELQSWNMKSHIGTSGSGRYFTFVYTNNYENGIATETINLFVPKGTKDIKIIGHNYNSNVFLKL